MCYLSQFPMVFCDLGVANTVFFIYLRIWRDKSPLFSHSKDIPYWTYLAGAILYLNQFPMVCHDLGVENTLFYSRFQGPYEQEAHIAWFTIYFMLNMPGGHFISQPIPHHFLWSWGRLHSILLSFEGHVSKIGLHFSVQKIFHVKVASRAFSISHNSPLFPMILWSFSHYIVGVWRPQRDLRIPMCFPKDISLLFPLLF